MAAEGGGEETASLSPKNRVKFLCSHGGKILPRPADGNLKYVGGETRVVAFPRDINFSELMKKLTTLIDGDMVLKYQLIPEDLDALVSVRSDEDLRHMLNEYDRQETEGSPRLRAFLFPSNPIILENQITSLDPHALEQRYIDAINGIIRTTPTLKLTHRPTFSISPTCSSPQTPSPEKYKADSMNQESVFWNGYQNGQNGQNDRVHMHKVQSSPSLCSLNDYQQHQNQQSNNHYHQNQQHYHHYHQNHHHHSYNYSRPPLDPHKSSGAERLITALSTGRTDGRGQLGYGIDHYYSTPRYQKGCGGYNKYGQFDECCAYGVHRIDRADSLPRSPRKSPWE